ncbi:serine hydrolase domain-containing protein [Desulfobacula phenolica]|uniref:CubicO group peptidase, beta-lactamase class C family n=1 Tax=Desulfobacula phenolica TaxID=90732 RepID=A0A1H2G5R1_9BACT|nr:serine hydrolase domain-containing protein [Desulfobacula phenolica]SDU14942.1 CubicO group peptidase, beta-lactamase class C family [Desulfobacula phenolica]
MGKDKISKLMEQAILKGIFPGAVLLCAVNQKIVFFEAYGMADLFNKRKMRKDSIFDLASLTKPLATALAVLKLVEKRQVFLDQKIGSILEEFKTSDKADITIDMLLRHTSGFPAHREYFKKIITTAKLPRQCLRDFLVHEPLENRVNTCQVYSDLGFMLIAWIIETITCQRLDHFVSEQIYRPLGIDDLFFIKLNQHNEKLKKYRQKIVATQQCPWRKRVLAGEVDDDNAWAAGGIEGHAGLFGSAGSIYKLCCEILNAVQNKKTIVLAPDIIKSFVLKKNKHDMVAGFDTPSKENSSSGRYFSKSSIGHLGFTGTSFWIDPEISKIIIFLSNRVHPLRSNEGIKKFRPQLHDLIHAQLI